MFLTEKGASGQQREHPAQTTGSDGGAAPCRGQGLGVSLGVPPSPSRLMGWPSDAEASLFLGRRGVATGGG